MVCAIGKLGTLFPQTPLISASARCKNECQYPSSRCSTISVPSDSSQYANRKIRATHKSFLSNFEKYFLNNVGTCRKALKGDPLAEFRIDTLKLYQITDVQHVLMSHEEH